MADVVILSTQTTPDAAAESTTVDSRFDLFYYEDDGHAKQARTRRKSSRIWSVLYFEVDDEEEETRLTEPAPV